MRLVGRLSVVAVLLLSSATTTLAQSDSSFAIGGQFTIRNPAMQGARGSADVGLLWRIGHGGTGWGWKWSFNWFSTDLDRMIGPRQIELGELKVRPFMAGYGYRYLIDGVSVELNTTGGYALTSIRMTPAAVDAYRDVLGAGSASADVANTFVIRPEVGIWFDLTRNIGVNVNAGYMIARPRLTIHTSIGDESQRIRADMFSVKIGMAYRVF